MYCQQRWRDNMNQRVRLIHIAVVLLFAWGLLGTGSNALAQVTTASVTGRVVDATGAGVPDAMITVTNQETGITRTANSDGEGEYRVLQLVVGRYQVKAEKSGFSAAEQTGLA